MTCRLSDFTHGEIVSNGRRRPYGAADAPHGDVELQGEYILIDDEFTVPASGGEFGVWTYGLFLRLEFLSLYITSDHGTLNVAYQTDEPTDAEGEDWTPSGSEPRWRFWPDLTCKMGPIRMNSDLLLGHTDAAKEVDDNGLGAPAIWYDWVAEAATRKVYRVRVRNEGDEAVTARRVLIGYQI